MSLTSGIVLAPISALYGALTRARLALYRAGALKVQRVGVPVISIGNLTAGGTGKTPLVEWVARASAREGKRVCILTRGYGRRDESARVLVSDGERVLANEREGGDEPLLLAETLRGVAAVLSDANRVAAAKWAIENLRSEVFILDDGFQHLRLARNLDIVTIDATNAWGGGHLLPRGYLREPREGLARADIVVITRADQSRQIEELSAEARRLSGGRPVFISSTRTSALRTLPQMMDEKGAIIDGALPQPVAAFCAIGNPNSFFTHARKDGHTLKFTRAFPDHHVYTQSDVDTLSREACEQGAKALLTTAKDAVKLRHLRFELPCYVLEVEMRFDDEDELRRMIREAVNAVAS